MARIVVEGIEKSYVGPAGSTVWALGGVDLTLEEGEFVCLLGPSGCGKTTLLNVIAGLASPDAGRVRIEAHSDRLPVVRTVFQQPRLLPWMTVRENLAFVIDGPAAAKDELIDDWLDRVGLAGTAAFYPRQLSIGMQHRVSVARGLIVEPDVLLMDEPFGALDELTAMTMREELLALWREIGCSVAFVTHNPMEATLLADRVVIMSDSPGRVVHEERLSELLERPRDPDDERLWRLSRRAVAHLQRGTPAESERAPQA